MIQRIKAANNIKVLSEGEDGIAFQVRFKRQWLRVIASNGMDWDHASVSLPHRTPTWEEMSFIKNLVFGPEKLAVQYHPPGHDYVNIHEHCLHLWRPQKQDVPMPLIEMV